MKASMIVKSDISNLVVALDFIKAEMEKEGCKSHEINKAMLICEEVMVATINHAPLDSEIEITVKKSFGKLLLDISALGSEFNVLDLNNSDIVLSDLENSQVEYAIRSMLMRHYSDRVRYSRRGDGNYVKVILKQDEHLQIKMLMLSLVSAIILGLIFRMLMPGVGAVLNTNLFSPISSIFIRCMKCIVGPIVFLSILSSVIGFDDMKLLGRLGAKVMTIYTITSVIATFVGMGIFYLFSPGELGSYVINETGTVEQTQTGGLIDMLVQIFPNNFFAAFINNDTVQLIVLAIACGIALNAMGKKNEKVKELIVTVYEMVMLICNYISKIIPLVIICSISSLILTVEAETIISLFKMAGVIIIGYLVMVVVYSLMILIFAKVNPLVLIKKYAGTALTVFTLSSSNATIPLNMEFSNKIGVSKKVSSFAIPLGATINMDGGCICFPIMVLFLSKIYGVTFSAGMLFQLFFMVIMISMGTPGIAGGTCALIIPMLQMAGVPAEIALLILGIDTIIDMFRTVLNTLGDQCSTLIAVNSEKLFDKEKYYGKMQKS